MYHGKGSEKFISNFDMVRGRVVFSPIVGQIGLTWLPEEATLVLVDTSVSEPGESHVHGLYSFWLDTTVDDTFDGTVGILYRCRGLKMTQFLQYVAYFNSFTCIDI